ncbi:hypothetical protein OS493_013377 [Desmophyllum pertusum]|uniref:Uncharacterized protein n=1 Tax=Desmophyllum pertusum TaxID=174260 RepID=A0A9W9YF95_9CNID|nr:hypothetical protein OS493_013377 [Desmophyllum pertusum]
MLGAVVEFLVYIIESFTGSVIENYSATTCRRVCTDHSGDSDEVQALVHEDDALSDFTNFDSDDAVFQEFDSPLGSSGKMAWKHSRPPAWKSALTCFKTVVIIQFLFGFSIGLLAIAIAVIDFNTADLCYEKTFRWNSMPRIIQGIRVTGQCVEGFFIQLWHFCIMLCVFGCSTMKELNLLTINLLAAFTDTIYRLCLQIFGIYKRPWMSYPLNVLSVSVIIGNSLIIAKRIIPAPMYSKKAVSNVAGVLAVQFILGLPVCYALVYKILPWYNEKTEIEKVFIAGVIPIVVSVPKVIARTAVPKLNLVHPGVLHLLVSILYTATAVVSRIMQAELIDFSLFVALGVGHAMIDLVERITVTMRDHIWEYAYKLLSRCSRSQMRDFHAGKARTPRSMRFVADISIQLLLTEAGALVSSVGFIQLYKFMYPDQNMQTPEDYFWVLILEFIKRCFTGLAIDVVFNTISVWLQVTLFNIAVLRVWNTKWRSHVITNVVCMVLVFLYFSEYLFPIVRGKNDGKTAKRFAFNCSLPFSKLY